MDLALMYSISVILGVVSTSIKVSKKENIMKEKNLGFKDWEASLKQMKKDSLLSFIPLYNLYDFLVTFIKAAKNDNTKYIKHVYAEMEKGNIVSIDSIKENNEEAKINENWFEKSKKEDAYKKSYEQIEFEKLDRKEKIEFLRKEIEKLKNEEQEEMNKSKEFINILELAEKGLK